MKTLDWTKPIQTTGGLHATYLGDLNVHERVIRILNLNGVEHILVVRDDGINHMGTQHIQNVPEKMVEVTVYLNPWKGNKDTLRSAFTTIKKALVAMTGDSSRYLDTEPHAFKCQMSEERAKALGFDYVTL